MTDLTLERHDRLDPATGEEVQALIEEAAVHDGRSPVGEHTFMKVREGTDDSFAILARLGDRLVGYAQATRYAAHGAQPPHVASELLVDARHRGRGIGAALLDRVAEEARRSGAHRLDAWAHHADAAAIGLAESRGMRAGRHLWQMALRLDAVSAAHRRAPRPQGVGLVTFDAESDADELIRVVRAAFPEHPENANFDHDDLLARQRLPWYDPEGILLARDEASGRLLGLHWGKLDTGTERAEVHMLAISPEAQGSGLGRWLLLEGLAWMRARGARLAYLYVDAENEAAVALYRQVGFRHEHLDTCYELPLPPPAEGRR